MLSRVLCVGAEGFIGSRLMKHHPDWVSLDLKSYENFCEDDYIGYDAIVMLAAHHINFQPEDYTYNLELYRALSKFVMSNDNPFVLFVSSAAVYEPVIDGSHKEDEFLLPASLYGRSKRVGEQIVEDISDNYTIIRLSNVYGDGDGHGAIDSFKMGGNVIYGDGQQVRDYIYVDKVVTAIDRIMASPSRYLGQTYNISTNTGQTTEDVFNLYGHGGAEHKPARYGDVAFSMLDNSKAKQDGLL